MKIFRLRDEKWSIIPYMEKIVRTSGYSETRLLRKGDIEQFGRDLHNYHVRTDGNLQTVGSVFMAPAAFIAKFPNAIAGAVGEQPAEALPEGHLKYMRRDAKSAITNLLGGVLTLRPGKILKGAFDTLDLLTIDPLLDAGSAIFGHTRKQVDSRLSTAA